MDQKLTIRKDAGLRSEESRRLETRRILTLHFLHEMDYEAIGEIMGLPSAEVCSCCTNFARVFTNKQAIMDVVKTLDEQENGACAKNSNEDEVADRQPTPAEYREVLRRLKELQSRLKEAELRADAYDEMINVAEAMFEIPIRKKAGAKQ